MESKSMQTLEVPAVTLDTLNDYCLRHVFKMLPLKDRIVVECVSKRFKELSESLWKQQQVLLVNTRNLWSLNYITCITTKHLQGVLIRCGISLQTLVVKDINETSTLFAIGKYCPNIKHLILYRVPVSSDGINYLSLCYKDLYKINLKQCDFLTDDMLTSLLLANERIQQLNLRDHIDIKGSCFNFITQSVQSIDVTGCYTLNDEHLIKNFNRFNNLFKLNLSRCYFLTNSVIYCISVYNTQLKELSLRDNPFVNEETLQMLTNGCSQLESLDISGCTTNIANNGFQKLIRLSKLKTLKLEWLTSVTDDILFSLSSVQTLRQLSLCGCEFITDLGIISILESCVNLTHLNVARCKKITNRTITEAIQVMQERKTNTPLTLDVLYTVVIPHQIPKSLPELLTIKTTF